MNISFSGVDLELAIEERSENDKDGNEIKTSISIVKTTDQLNAEVSYQIHTDGTRQIGLTEFLATPPPIYDHLNRNGRMPVTVVEDRQEHVALLRALRRGGRDWPTLNKVTEDELDQLLGSSVRDWLTSLDIKLGTWESLNPNAKRHKDALAVAVSAENSIRLVAPWALTRVIALMKKLGENNLDTA